MELRFGKLARNINIVVFITNYAIFLPVILFVGSSAFAEGKNDIKNKTNDLIQLFWNFWTKNNTTKAEKFPLSGSQNYSNQMEYSCCEYNCDFYMHYLYNYGKCIL